MSNKSILVAGGGGFIGGYLVSRFRDMGYKRIRSVDIKPSTSGTSHSTTWKT
jgi:GDP-D-mannose 3', 5'-epimerase